MNTGDSDNKGLSLVEVICAVAIFSVITATIGGVLVFSARSYQKGSTESEIQQEAQFAANRISGIIQNATEVSFSAPTLEMKKGNVVYKVSFNEENKNLEYRETVKAADGTETTSDAQILAGNIKDFKADVSEFDVAHTVILDMIVAKNNKEYPVRYTMNARNEEIAVSTSALPPKASIHVDDSSLILVPGESYTVGVDVRGRGADKSFDVSASDGITVSKAADSITVSVNSDNRNSSGEYVEVYVKNPDGTKLCSKMIHIDIRCVTEVKTQKNQNAGTGEYTIYADVICQNAAKIVGGSNEDNYKNPYMVTWSGQLMVCSSTPGNFDTEIANFQVERVGDENKIVFTNEEEVKKYISLDDTYLMVGNQKMGIDDKHTEDKISSKQPAGLTVKLTENFDSNTKLIIKAESTHAAGINKASSAYGDYSGEAEITVPKLKATKLLMVPGQTYTLNGVRVVNPECSVYIGSTEIANPGDAGVIPVFESGNKLKITLNEKAKGDNNGVITLKIHSQGSTATQLTVEVYVRRVNPQEQSGEVRKGNLKIDYQLMTGDGKSVNGEWGVGAEYQFKARINGTNLFFNDTAGFMNTETEEQYKQYNPFAVEFSWVLKIAGEEQAETKGGAVVTYYEHGAEGASVGAIAESTTGSQSNQYFAINSFALNRESPAVNIITRKAFPNDWELVVTARALHPNEDGTKGRNKYNYIYTEAPDKYIEGSYTLKKKDSIKVAKESIIVESYQGENPEKAMVVPVHIVNGAKVAVLKVKLEGSSDPDNTIVLNGNKKTGENGAVEWIIPNASSQCDIKLKISEKEKGSKINDGLGEKDGRIKMTVLAYDSAEMNRPIDTVTVYLEVRRVQKVEIADKSVFNNKAGSTITLEAKASGIEGTDYFGRQMKTNEYEPVWESRYDEISPFKLMWSLYYKDRNNKVTEIEIDKYGEYFSNVKYGSKEDGTQTVTFTLNKALPDGVQIRATSLHAMGKFGDKERNRSGLNYIKGVDASYPEGIVFDFIEVKSAFIVADGFKRGKDYTFIKDIVNVRADVFEWGTWLEQASFYRYKELDAVTWSKYHMMDSGPTTQAWANYVPMSYLFRPDKEYAIEIVSVLYNKTDKLIYWPLDEELLEPGRGWAEAGFTLWKPTQEQWKRDLPSASEYWWPYTKYEECYNKVQGIAEVKQTFMIPKSEMSFYTREDASSNNALTVSERVTSVGSESEPIRLNGNNGNVSEHSAFIVNLEITGYEMNTDQQCFRTIVQKKSGDQWVTLGYDDDPIISGVEGFKVDSANPYISIYRTANAQGLYRVVPVILAGDKTGGKIKWRDVTDTPRSGYTDMDVLFHPEYTTTEESYHLYDYSTGKYVIYFEFYR